ncbi:hypothetical protein OAA91_00345 [Fibrobacterales bacterium]|nr:hypothetical protein [Fibrobacterales bacterium]
MKVSNTIKSLLVGLLTTSVFAQQNPGEIVPQNTYVGMRSSLSGAGISNREGEFYNAENPALHSFYDKAVFTGSLGYSELAISKKDALQSSISLKQFAFLFPVSFLNIGAAYKEEALINSSFTNSDSLLIQETGNLASARGQVAARWNNFGLGTSINYFFGSSRTLLRIPVQAEEFDPYSFMSEEAKFELEGTNLTNSLYAEFGVWGVTASYTTALTLEKKITRKQRILGQSSTDSTILNSGQHSVRTIKNTMNSSEIPAELAVGLAYIPKRLNRVFLDFKTQLSPTKIAGQNKQGLQKSTVDREYNADFQASIGYSFGASKKMFETIWKRTAVHVGLSYEQYLETPLAGAAAGFSFPLGKRGARVDVSTYNKFNLDEDFRLAQSGFDLTLVGLGNWGQPSRRYR